MNPKKRNRRLPQTADKGFVLASVLAILILLSFVTASILMSTQTSLRLALLNEQEAQNDALLDAGIMSAIATIGGSPEQYEPERLPALGQVELNGNRIEFEITNETTRLDFNVADAQLLELVFVQWGLGQEEASELSARVVDWRDQDSILSEGGAEFSEYRTRNLAPPGNRRFLNIDEVARVLEFPPDLISCLRSMGTVYSGRSYPAEPYIGVSIAVPVGIYLEQMGIAVGSNAISTGPRSQVGRIYRIIASISSDDDVEMSRGAVIQFTGGMDRSYWVLDWFVPRSATPENVCS